MTNKTYDEQALVQLSALEHYSYCPRQCALIHLEQVWDENLYTMRGRATHESVDVESSHELSGVRFERSLPVWSKRLSLVGKADMVEFYGEVPYPVEYKSGRRKKGRPEELQLCAQAVCLEEMLCCAVPKGALYWHGSRERKEIAFTDEMKRRVEETALAVNEMIALRRVPEPVNDRRCRDCSISSACMPDVIAEKSRSAAAILKLWEE